MKVNELLQLYEELGAKALDQLKIKDRLPTLYKVALIAQVCEGKITYNSQGMAMTNKLLNEALFCVCILEEYAGIKFTTLDTEGQRGITLAFEEYDQLEMLGLVDSIIAKIDVREYTYLKRAYVEKIDIELRLANSIENILNRKLTALTEEITALLNELPKQFSPDSLNIIAAQIEKLPGILGPLLNKAK